MHKERSKFQRCDPVCNEESSSGLSQLPRYCDLDSLNILITQHTFNYFFILFFKLYTLINTFIYYLGFYTGYPIFIYVYNVIIYF